MAEKREKPVAAKKAPGRRSSDAPPCPTCASAATVVPIAWGFPTPATFAEAEAGRAHLGGCVVTGADPDWHCKACGHDFVRAGGPARR